ncbi:MAG: hypothetical protein AAFQ80_21280 [Cyanobacteria bacterium J06621_8]
MSKDNGCSKLFLPITDAVSEAMPKAYRSLEFSTEIEREGRWGFPSLSNHAVESQAQSEDKSAIVFPPKYWF